MFVFIGFPSLLLKKPKFWFFGVSKQRVLCNRSRREDSICIKIVSNGANLDSFWSRPSFILVLRHHYIHITSVLRQYYVNIISTLRQHYVNITSILHQYYVNITSISDQKPNFVTAGGSSIFKRILGTCKMSRCQIDRFENTQ